MIEVFIIGYLLGMITVWKWDAIKNVIKNWRKKNES